MSLRNFIRQTRLLLAQSLYEMRGAMTTQDESSFRPLQVTQLEERILMSASPLAVVAESPDATAATSEQNDQQLLDVVADTVLPKQSATTDTADAGGDPLDVVLIDSSLSDVEVLLEAVDEDAIAILYDGADGTIIEVLAQVEDVAEASGSKIASLSIVSHGSGGQFDLGGEVVTNEMTADQSAAWLTLTDSFSEDANIYIYGCDVVDGAGEGQELLDLLSELTGTEVYGSDDTTGAGGDWDLEAVSIGGEHELAAGAVAPLNASVLSGYQGTLSEPTLVAHWTFDEASGQTLTDITGNGNDGTLGSTTGADGNDPTWTIDGTRGSVLTFDGNQDYVTGIGNSPSGSFTVAGWGNTTSGGPSDYHAMYSADTEIWLGVDDASEFIYMYVGGDGDYVYTANNSWTHDTWHHLAGTWDGTSAHIYIDGADQSLTTVGTLNDPIATAGVIGAWSTNLSEDEWDGSIDDVLIYDDALDSAAITKLANDAPTAVDVAFTTDEDVAVTTSDVLSAGFDPNDDTLSIDSFTQGTNGTVVDNNDGTLTYTPDADFDGVDTFNYTVDDGNGNTDTATVTITVNPVAPVITARETVDSDGNGQIDQIRITTDENLDDDFTGLTMTVAGYTVTGYSSDIANDNIFYVDLTEGGTSDTDATPDVTVTANTSLSDAGNYNIATDDWWDTDWLNRRKITFDNTASAENLDDFPLLVAITSSEINYAKTQDQGQDIRFYDTDTNQLLKYEIEEWNEAGTSYVWVRVPRIDAGVATDSIMMYYNNTAASDGQDAANVWDSSFQMVYHANESSGNLQDSTSNTNDGTAAGTAGYGATGAIGSGVDLERDDSARFVVNSLTLDPSTTDLTIQAWIRPEDINVSQPFFSQKDGTGQGRTLLRLDTANEADTWLGGTSLSADTALGSGTFYHLVLTYDNTAGVVHFYLNGNSDSTDISASAESASGSWVVGSHKDESSFFDGIMDEMRVSSTLRSADWIEAEYLSQNGAFSFNTFGNEENQSGSSITAVDKAAAAITARETVDSDGNGQIDQIRITASETLDDDFTGLTVTVAGYTVTGYSSDTANDNIFYVNLTESGTADTDATPAVLVTVNTTLSDTNNTNTAVDDTGGWLDTNWQNRARITFDNSDQVTSNLDDFPVLVTIDTSKLASLDLSATAGADVRFTDATTGTELKYEVESWDDGADTATIWVKVPRIDVGSASDYIFIYYNYNGTATYDQSAADEQSVWDANYAAVLHLNETVDDDTSSGSHVDSTGANTATQNDNDETTGQIGQGQYLDGTDDFIVIADDDSLSFGDGTTDNAFSMSAWINRDNTGDRGVIMSKDNFSNVEYEFWVGGSDKLNFNLHDSGGNILSVRTTGVLGADWTHVSATYDGSGSVGGLRLYINGLEVAVSDTSSGVYSAMSNTSHNLNIGEGGYADNYDFEGIIDEARVSGTERTADWIKASYLSQNGTFAFINFGSEEVEASLLTTDKAGPVILSMDMSDSNLIAGETSTVTVTFSEAVQDVSGFLPNNGTVSVATSADGGVTWTSTFTPTDGIVDPTNNLFLLGWFDDLANNSTFALEAPGNYTIETTTPTITARETFDSDANGQIDTIRITTDENLDDDFSGLTVTVAGYTVTGYSSDIANDNIFYVDLTESGTPDTGATPAVTVTANTTLSDAAGNNIAVDAGLAATDKAAAVLISAATPQSMGSNLFQAQGQQLDLVFSETLGSSISEVNLEAALLFAAGATDADNLPTIGTGTNPISLVTTSDTNDTIRITYNADNTANANWTLVGTHTVQVTTGTNITDAAGNTANTAGAAVTITGDTNDAPVLDNGGTMTLTNISEDNFTSPGDTVANIILSASGDRITDNDTVPVEGMAVIGVDDTNGTWQYNTGSGWAGFGAVSNTSAILLNPSATIRFVPDANYAGSSGDITFRAWDQTSGSNGDTAVNVSSNGGTTAFSTATETASLTVTGVNDAPVITSSSTASVAENQSATLTVTSTDIDGGTPSYSLSGGADQTKFSINSSTGELTFSTVPDFENPADVGTNNVYEVQVTVSDGNGGMDVQSISVTVTDANDDPVITSSSTASVAENQTAVLTVTTTDQDLPADTITYSLTGGADQAEFSINSSTGVLTFNTAPDFENPSDAGTNNVYEVQVTANDGAGGTDVQSISVTVTDVNEAPVITSSSTASVAENQTAVLTVTTTDVDLPGDTITYSLSGGADESKFSINSSSGVLTFSTAPDFENPTDVGTNNVYDVQVTASDGAGGTDVQSVSLTVTDVNEAPVITSSSTASVVENQTAVLTVTTTDVDLPGDTITYSLSGGADQSKFSINSSSGVLTFSTAPDFEIPTDVGTDNVYEVQVTANDGAGGTDVQSISVTVTDVNEAPVITSSSTASVAENQMAVLTVTATDQDVPADTVTYSLTGGADQARFSINASTGVLKFNTPPDFETPTDVGTNNVYDVQVTANDGAGGTDVQSISVTVTDVNESPTITPIADQTPLEDTATGAIAFTVGDPETAAGSLTVTATSNNQTLVPDGNITLGGSGANRTINILPGLNQTGGPATITVTVDDGTTTTQTTFDVTVTAVNDAPTLSTIANQVVQEDTATGAIAFTVGDVETPAGTLTVTATSNDQTLVPDGNITLGGSGANRTINVLPGIDQLGGPVTITVTVDDGTTTTQTTFDVTVTPVNDAPTVVLPGGAVNFTEGDAATIIDGLAIVSDVDSPDFDTGTLTVDFTVNGTANDRLTINNQGTGSDQIGVSGSDVTYEGVTIGAFAGGTDGSTPLVVTLNASATPSAVQALARNISYENVSQDPSTAARTVRFVLTDGDSGTSSSETETINITTVNDLSVVTTDPTTLTYTGVSAIDVDQTLTITDVDDSVLVSAEVQLSNGFIEGEDTLVFVDQLGITGAFNGTTGILTLTGSATLADYETALRSVQYDNVNSSPTLGLLWVEFTVNDGMDDSVAARRRVEIIDEDPPRATSDAVTLAEGDSIVIDLAANDSDNFGLLDLASISIVSAPSNGTLAVNGDGTVTYTHDGSETTTDTFTYTIEDTSDLLSNTATVSLIITPVNEAPTDIALSGNTIDENSTNGTIVGNAAGTDSDVGDSLTFSLTNDAGGRFAVDLNTGQLTVADGSLLNFEAASSHSITIRATDSGGLTYDESFTVSVNDVNEAPTALDDAFSARQLEDLVVPAGVIMTNDFDVDGDSITVVLVTGPAEGTLSLAADGSFTYSPIDAFSGMDQFTYYVTDGTLNSAAATVNIDVAITVTPVDTTPPVVSEPPPETADNTVESERSETTDSETTDEISNEDTEATIRPPVAAAPDSTTAQDSGASTKTDKSAEMVKQTANAVFVSAFLTDVPEVEALDKDTRTLQSGAEQAVNGGPEQTGRFLVRQTDAIRPLFAAGQIDPDDVGNEQQPSEHFVQQQIAEKMVVGTSAVFSTSVSVGYLIWLLRGGSLLTTFLSSLPTWQAFDPLAVLESFDQSGNENEDTESLTSLVTSGE
jgi:hypothetical protein